MPSGKEGNQTRAHNKANEVGVIGIASMGTGSNWVDPTYDAAGNTLTTPWPSIPNWPSPITMTYDAWNRLVKVQLGTLTIMTCEYDGLNRRIVKTDDGLTKHSYYNEDWQELEVRKESGGSEVSTPIEQLVWHPYYIDALATRFWDANASGSQTQHYMTHDANFNVTAAINTSGTPVERYDYSPYGVTTFLDGSFAGLSGNVTAIGNNTTYTGRRWDPTVGLYHYRNRSYNPALGRFMTRDPIGYEDAMSLYVSFYSSPANYYDPTGLIIEPHDSISKYVKGCMKLPTYQLKLKCIEAAGGGIHYEILNCELIHEAYSAIICESCKECDSKSVNAARMATCSEQVVLRNTYLRMKCDYKLPGSIAKGSKKAEQGHRQQITEKTAVITKCMAIIAKSK